jgi:hypothetical protein
MEGDLKFLKSHTEDLRRCIEQLLKDTPRKVALALFDIWKNDLSKDNVVKNGAGAYVSADPIPPSSFATKLGMRGIKSPVSRARTGLQGHLNPIGGRLLSLDISDRSYAFCVTIATDPFATQRLIWSPYIVKEPTIVATVKRVFFKINKDVYVRNVTVDNESAWTKCDVLKKLIGRKGEVHAVRLYAPSGEVASAFGLLDVFNHQLNIRAVGRVIAPYYRHAGQNIIVLGSGIEEPHYPPQPSTNFKFWLKNLKDGVQNLKSRIKFSDETSDQAAKIHVVVQRWRKSDGKVMSVIYGSHAAAIEFVVENLVSEEKASILISKFPRIKRWLTRHVEFECLFAVDLIREGMYFDPSDISVVWPSPRPIRFPKTRHAKRVLRKGA